MGLARDAHGGAAVAEETRVKSGALYYVWTKTPGSFTHEGARESGVQIHFVKYAKV